MFFNEDIIDNIFKLAGDNITKCCVKLTKKAFYERYVPERMGCYCDMFKSEANAQKNKDGVRYFAAMFGKNELGCFCGKTPKQAASKIFSSIIKKIPEENGLPEGWLNFALKEITEGSNNSIYHCSGQCTKLDEPYQITIGGVNKTFSFKNEIKRAICQKICQWRINFNINLKQNGECEGDNANLINLD